MIKVKVLKDFYVAKDSYMYLDEDRYKELKAKGLVEEEKEVKEKATKPKNNVEVR